MKKQEEISLPLSAVLDSVAQTEKKLDYFPAAVLLYLPLLPVAHNYYFVLGLRQRWVQSEGGDGYCRLRRRGQGVVLDEIWIEELWV